MPFSSAPLDFVKTFPGASVLATVALIAGAAFTLKGPVTGAVPIGAHVSEIKTGSGSLRGYCDDTGSCSQSGGLVVGSKKTGSGKLTIDGLDGGKSCVADGDGVGYTIQECNNGTCTTRIAPAGECP